jgi:hypothetical protein
MTVEIMLAALLVVTNILWAINTHRLINKLMSRSFIEYREAFKEPVKVKQKEMPNDFEDFGSLSEVMP